MRKSEIIQKLNSLDLHNCSDQEIIKLIDNNSYAIQVFDVNPGQVVYRATVLNENESVENVTLRRLSYRAAQDSKNYQRSSIPGHTMFYGILPNCEEEKYRCSGIAAALFETSRFFREKPFQTDWQVHVVSEWILAKPITLIAIANPYSDNKSSRLNDCAEGYYAIVKDNYSPDLAEEEIAFQDYIFKQFSTPVAEDCEYKISALFATKLLEEAKRKDLKYDGFVWQSAINKDAKLNDCLCVAILPETIENSFQSPDHFYYVEEFADPIKLKLKIIC